MKLLVLNGLGERMDLHLQQGVKFGPMDCTLRNPDLSPVDLTGATFFGGIRKSAKSAQVLATITVSYTNRVAGQYRWWIEAAATGALPCGELLNSPESQYIWDFFMRDAAGTDIPRYYGLVLVNRRASVIPPP